MPEQKKQGSSDSQGSSGGVGHGEEDQVARRRERGRVLLRNLSGEGGGTDSGSHHSPVRRPSLVSDHYKEGAFTPNWGTPKKSSADQNLVVAVDEEEDGSRRGSALVVDGERMEAGSQQRRIMRRRRRLSSAAAAIALKKREHFQNNILTLGGAGERQRRSNKALYLYTTQFSSYSYL